MKTAEKELRELFPPEGKWKIRENPEQWDHDDREAPEFPLPRTEGLRINACDRASQNNQPNQSETQPHLPAELGGVKTKPIENFAHWRGCPRIPGAEKLT